MERVCSLRTSHFAFQSQLAKPSSFMLALPLLTIWEDKKSSAELPREGALPMPPLE
jgi:hypothetical protein